MLVFSLISSLLPIGLLVLTLVFAPTTQAVHEDQLSSQVAAEFNAQLAKHAKARALAIDTRLGCLGYSVKLLRAYAEEVLSAPAVFAAQVAPGFTGSGSATEEEPESGKDGEGELSEPAPLDNPLFYSKGEDGAIRKLIDDGRPAVYFAARVDGQFTDYDWQRLYASTMLDSLLREPATSDGLCSQAFLITRDGLLRTYPFQDFSIWPADKDLSKPRDYWDPAKADANGLIWTTPYVSAISGQWVVACISAAMAGDRVIAVVGVELDISQLAPEVLQDGADEASLSWLFKPVLTGGDQPQQWLVLATEEGGKDRLGVFPLASAALPDDKVFGPDILDQADLLAHGSDNLLDLVERNLDSHSTDLAELITDVEVTHGADQQILITAPVRETGWVLCTVTTSNALKVIEQFEARNQSWLHQRLLIAIGILLLAVLLAFLTAWQEARQIVHPLNILTEQVRQSVQTGRTSSVLLTDEGELGALAAAVQDLIDATTRGNGNGSTPGDSPPADQS